LNKLRVVIASPGDVRAAREAAAEVVGAVATEATTIDCIETFRWEKNVPPSFTRDSIQIGLIDPRARVADSDVLIVLFSRRLGSPIAPGKPTGTEHEFQAAYDSWRTTGRPQIMVYFNDTPFSPASMSKEDADQFAALMKFRFSFPSQGLYGTFDSIDDLRTKLTEHLKIVFEEVSTRVKKPFNVEDFNARVQDVDPQNYSRLRVPDSHRLYSSFSLDNPGRPFLRLKVLTTPGHVPNLEYPEKSEQRWNDVEHWIYLIRDPVRPFEIQIGEYRALRYGREPREVPFEGVPDYSELHKLYPLIRNPDHRWLRIVFAELLSDARALAYMGQHELDDEAVRKVIARNPSAPDELKKRECLFCDAAFRDERKVSRFDGDARIIANDFPFGPYFHYVVFPNEPIHSWDKVEERHLYDINWLAYRHLKRQFDRNELSGAAGLRIGLNSSIRHLVLGRRTRTSAGASVAHVHKQIWGMAPESVNLADHLRSICMAYEAQDPPRDYLGSYCEALQSAGLVIWEDKHVLIYVPFGQIAVHELQIMLREPGRRTFLDLTEPEIKSLSQAEWIVTQLYNRLDINSFNEILLSLPFNDRESSTFRLIFTFITREVDLAVSELSLLYVVDQHPSHTVREINRVWPSRDPADFMRATESRET
jgi:hypothetical protein